MLKRTIIYDGNKKTFHSHVCVNCNLINISFSIINNEQTLSFQGLSKIYDQT